MKIATKVGDKGRTKLLGEKFCLKDNPLVNLLGEIDELNSFLGLYASFSSSLSQKKILHTQKILFLSGKLLLLKESKFPELETENLEKQIEEMEKKLPSLNHFIIPGGSKKAGFCHVCRAVCRRVERSLVHLKKTQKVDPLILVYFNRLSDWLFLLARWENKIARKREIII
jgi:cob(I)alamin adenosyltransferase